MIRLCVQSSPLLTERMDTTIDEYHLKILRTLQCKPIHYNRTKMHKHNFVVYDKVETTLPIKL